MGKKENLPMLPNCATLKFGVKLSMKLLFTVLRYKKVFLITLPLLAITSSHA